MFSPKNRLRLGLGGAENLEQTKCSDLLPTAHDHQPMLSMADISTIELTEFTNERLFPVAADALNPLNLGVPLHI
jgi:hypothetical protein